MVGGERRLLTIDNVGALVFGPGAALRCADDLKARGSRSVFLVTTPPTRFLSEPLVAALEAGGCRVCMWQDLAGEPTIPEFRSALAAARDAKADAVIGLGGGSAMDVAKLVAALFDSRQEIEEVLGVDRLSGRALWVGCIPTTAGTGSEVTPIAILGDQDEDLKKGVVSRHLVPDAAYLDPPLTVSMPPAVTAATGIDALTHCIEAYANRFAHPVVDAWALEGVRLVGRYLARAVEDGQDLEARSAMMRASLYGGLCLGPVNTAAVHALAYPLGGEFHVAHGVANGLLLPHVLRFNAEASPERYADIAEALEARAAGGAASRAAAGIEMVSALCRRCGVPDQMRRYGVKQADIPRMAKSAMTVTRLLERNLREVREADAMRIYEAAW